MEVDSADNNVLEMIKGLIILKIDVEAVFNSYFHLHRYNLICFLYFFVRQQNCKVYFFDNTEFSSHYNSNKVSHSAGNSIKGLVLFFKVRKPELEGLILTEYPCWF